MNSKMTIRLIGLVGGGLIGWNVGAYLERVTEGLDLTLRLGLLLVGGTALALAPDLAGLTITG